MTAAPRRRTAWPHREDQVVVVVVGLGQAGAGRALVAEAGPHRLQRARGQRCRWRTASGVRRRREPAWRLSPRRAVGVGRVVELQGVRRWGRPGPHRGVHPHGLAGGQVGAVQRRDHDPVVGLVDVVGAQVPSAQELLMVLGWLGSGPTPSRPSRRMGPESHRRPPSHTWAPGAPGRIRRSRWEAHRRVVVEDGAFALAVDDGGVGGVAQHQVEVLVGLERRRRRSRSRSPCGS